MPIVGKAVWPVPELVSFTPDNGKAGDTVTLTVLRATPDTTVNFAGTNGADTVPAEDVVVVSPTQITCKVPVGAGDAVYSGDLGTLHPRLQLVNEAGSHTLTSPRFIVNLPHVTSLDPTTAEEGAEVVATGVNFVDVTGIKVNDVTVDEYNVDSDTQITFTVPAGATTGDVVVTTDTGSDIDPPELEVGAGTLDLDFRAGIPSGVIVSRSGDSMLVASSEGVLAATGDDTPAWEDRGNGQSGLWLHGPYSNAIPDPFDLEAANWAPNASPTVTTVTGPDGTNRARRIQDTNGAGFGAQFYSGIGGTSAARVASVYYKEAAGLSKAGGVNWHSSYTPQGSRRNLTGALWRRSSIYHGGPSPVLRLYTTGLDPWGEFGGDDSSATGSTDWFGAQIVEGTVHELPLVDGSTQETVCQLDAGSLAKVIQGGDLDLHLTALTWVQARLLEAHPSSGWVWRGDGPDGVFGVYFDDGDGKFHFWVRGAEVAAAAVEYPTWGHGLLLEVRWTYSISTGQWRSMVAVQGVIGSSATLETEKIGSTAGGALAAPTSLWIASNGGSADWFPMQLRRFWGYASGTPVVRRTCKMARIGDSTSAIFSLGGQHPVLCGALTIAEVEAGIACVDLSVPGATIEDAQATYAASPYKGDPDLEIFSISLGINNLVLGNTGAAIKTKLQALIDDVAAGNPGAKIVIEAPTCFDAGAHWVTVYDSVANGEYTGVDMHDTSVSDAGNNGSNLLAAHWIWSAPHMVNELKLRMAALVRANAVTLGVLP